MAESIVYLWKEHGFIKASGILKTTFPMDTEVKEILDKYCLPS